MKGWKCIYQSEKLELWMNLNDNVWINIHHKTDRIIARLRYGKVPSKRNPQSYVLIAASLHKRSPTRARLSGLVLPQIQTSMEVKP